MAAEVHRLGAALSSEVSRIAADVSGVNADDVDRRARFPSEAIEALRACGALGAALPVELGGWGFGVGAVADLCTRLSRHCASTGMVFAMHQIQLCCLWHHARKLPGVTDYLRTVCADQRLIASATSEAEIGGDLRRSHCHVERNDTRCRVRKACTTVSYLEQADDVLLQARRGPDSPPSDQAMVLATRGSFTWSRHGTWDTLGMRGTCSPGAALEIDGDAWQALDVAFAEVVNETMVPVSHILWSGVWLGIARDAETKARKSVRLTARRSPGTTPPEAYALSELVGLVQTMSECVARTAHEYEALRASDPATLGGIGPMLRHNHLKLLSSSLVVDVVGRAMQICGIQAYRNDAPTSLGRQLRDAHSAVLMINNLRLQSTNAGLLLVHKGDEG